MKNFSTLKSIFQIFVSIVFIFSFFGKAKSANNEARVIFSITEISVNFISDSGTNEILDDENLQVEIGEKFKFEIKDPADSIVSANVTINSETYTLTKDEDGNWKSNEISLDEIKNYETIVSFVGKNGETYSITSTISVKTINLFEMKNGEENKISESGTQNINEDEEFDYKIVGDDIEGAKLIVNGEEFPAIFDDKKNAWFIKNLSFDEPGEYNAKIEYQKNGSTYDFDFTIKVEDTSLKLFEIRNGKTSEIFKNSKQEIIANETFDYKIIGDDLKNVKLNLNGIEYTAIFDESQDAWFVNDLKFSTPGNYSGTVFYQKNGNEYTFSFTLEVKGALVSTGTNFPILILPIIFLLLLPKFLINKQKQKEEKYEG
ncbi:MAG: hypothetical protein Fur0024_5020 [Patescibacteria group bacterium]